jgi:hypothetical protein
VHAEPSHWLHEISLSKTVHHHFSPGLTPFQELGYLTGEPAATSALVPHSVRWMGCVSSFSTRWGSSLSIFFWLLITGLSFFFRFFVVFFWPHLAHSYPTHLPTFISIALTLYLIKHPIMTYLPS